MGNLIGINPNCIGGNTYKLTSIYIFQAMVSRYDRLSFFPKPAQKSRLLNLALGYQSENFQIMR